MALTSVELVVSNNEYKGYMEISCIPKQSVSTQATYVLLYRKEHDSNKSYDLIYEKSILDRMSLGFVCIDLTTKSGKSYDYYIELTNGKEAGRRVYEFGTVYNVQCHFDGLFVGNSSAQYFAPLDCETSTTRNTQSNYVTTLVGRTPYRVSNSNLNYTTGQSSALFVPLDENGNPIRQSTREYVDNVIDFLTDGENKILKTSNGGAWNVSVDQNVQVEFDDYYIGRNNISFNWTEIDDIPLLIDDGSRAKRLVNKVIRANGEYFPVYDGADGYSELVVCVPVLLDVSVNENRHSIVVSTSGYEDPEVPEKITGADADISLIEKQVSSNGTYKAVLDNADGYGRVIVNVTGVDKSVVGHKLIFQAAS